MMIYFMENPPNIDDLEVPPYFRTPPFRCVLQDVKFHQPPRGITSTGIPHVTATQGDADAMQTWEELGPKRMSFSQRGGSIQLTQPSTRGFDQ